MVRGAVAASCRGRDRAGHVPIYNRRRVCRPGRQPRWADGDRSGGARVPCGGADGRRRGSPGELGIEIQPLSPTLASAAGAATGVVITAIDPAGSAAKSLVATEVVEAIDGEEVLTSDHWRARAARVSAGDTLTLRVRGIQVCATCQITAAPTIPAAEPDREIALGLRLRPVPRVGAEYSRSSRGRALRAPAFRLEISLPSRAGNLRRLRHSSPGVSRRCRRADPFWSRSLGAVSVT